jgi:hypothetical protein
MIAINNYLTIPGFTVSELHLSGVDRDVYSYIYSKSQDGLPTAIKTSWIAEWETCSERTIKRSLRRLEESGLICITQRSGLPSLYNINTDVKNKALDDGHSKLPDKDPRRIRSDRTDDDYINGKLRARRADDSAIIPQRESHSDGPNSEDGGVRNKAPAADFKALIRSGVDWTYPAILNQKGAK